MSKTFTERAKMAIWDLTQNCKKFQYCQKSIFFYKSRLRLEIDQIAQKFGITQKIFKKCPGNWKLSHKLLEIEQMRGNFVMIIENFQMI